MRAALLQPYRYGTHNKSNCVKLFLVGKFSIILNAHRIYLIPIYLISFALLNPFNFRKMHVISGLKKLAVASVMAGAVVTGESGAAKNSTAKEMREQCGKVRRRGWRRRGSRI